MDKLDLILVLQIQGDEAKWCLMSENWLQNQVTVAGNAAGKTAVHSLDLLF